MRDDILNILSHSNKNINNQQLMAYLAGELSDEEKRLLEEEMIDSDLLSDAVEGLATMESRSAIEGYTQDVNKKLLAYLNTDKKKSAKRRLKELPGLYVALAMILLLAIIAFVLVYLELLR